MQHGEQLVKLEKSIEWRKLLAGISLFSFFNLFNICFEYIDSSTSIVISFGDKQSRTLFRASAWRGLVHSIYMYITHIYFISMHIVCIFFWYLHNNQKRLKTTLKKKKKYILIWKVKYYINSLTYVYNQSFNTIWLLFFNLRASYYVWYN